MFQERFERRYIRDGRRKEERETFYSTDSITRSRVSRVLSRQKQFIRLYA